MVTSEQVRAEVRRLMMATRRGPYRRIVQAERLGRQPSKDDLRQHENAVNMIAFLMS